MPKDSIVLGASYRKAGIMAAYDPSREEDAVDDDRGLGAWQDRKNWNIVSLSTYRTLQILIQICLHLQTEWEERRVKRLAAITAMGGVVTFKSHVDADVFNE